MPELGKFERRDAAFREGARAILQDLLDEQAAWGVVALANDVEAHALWRTWVTRNYCLAVDIARRIFRRNTDEARERLAAIAVAATGGLPF